MRRRRPRAPGRYALAAAAAVAFAWPAPAPARPGGGHTYKGSSSSGSSRSSGSSSGPSRSSGGSFSSGSSRSSGTSSGSSSRSSGGSFSSGASRSSGASSDSSWSRRPSYSLPSGGTRSSGAATWSGGGTSGAAAPAGGGDASGSVGQYFFFAVVGALVLVVVLILLWNAYNGWRGAGWTASAGGLKRRLEAAERELASERAGAGGPRGLTPAEVVAKLRQRGAHDEDFSYALFEDFLYALYAEAHHARGGGRVGRVTPYFGDKARWVLMASLGAPAEVRDVVVGAMRVEAVRRANDGPGRVAVVVRFEANYVESGGEGGETAYYADERWTLERDAGAKSRPPEAARVLGCPGCGAPLDKVVGGACEHCGAAGWSGEGEWYVTAIEPVGREARSPAAGGYAEEVGTDRPTVVDPDVRERYAALREKDPAFEWPAFVARVEAIFAAFHEAWSSRELGKARPFLSDNLFEAQRYWVDAYRRAGLRNVTEGARVVSVHLARATSDKYYDALTVRVFATGLDYTLDGSGAVVGGDRERPREYSEYWTLVRGAGAQGAARADAACPNCGAPLDVNMAGHCAYCGAKVTAGAFDWVLSRVEQDEAYG